SCLMDEILKQLLYFFLLTLESDPLVQKLKEKNIKVVLGSHPLELLEDIDLIVKNPGIPYSNDLLLEASKRGIPIITEIELTYHLLDKQTLIGITGSNGKTTTTSLVREMFKEGKKDIVTAGNIGTVSIEVVEDLNPDDNLLLELSSFLLQDTKTFKPDIAAILNLYEAHIDFHG